MKTPQMPPRHPASRHVATRYLPWLALLTAPILLADPARADTTSGLVLHLPFDETSGTIAVNTAGTVNGTLQNFDEPDAAWTAGRVGGGLGFNSTDPQNNEVVIIDPTGFPDLNENPVFSVSFWAKAEPTQTNGAGLVTLGVGGGSETFCIDMFNNRYRFFVRNGVNSAATAVNTTISGNRTWQHIAATFDSSEGLMKMYINGVEVGSATAPTSLRAHADPLDIGARYSSGAYNLDFRGTLDDFRFYNRVLTAGDIQELIASAGTLPLSFVLQPQSTQVQIESPLHLHAMADSSAAISYQWWKDNGLIEGATSPTLTISSATFETAGSYHVVVDDGTGPLPSAAAIVTVQGPDLNRGLVMHFEFDETTGTTAADSSANEYHASLLNFPDADSHWVPGVIGGGVRINPPGSPTTTQQIITDDSVIFKNQNQFTFAFWAKPDPYNTLTNPRLIGPANGGHWVLWKPGFGVGIWPDVAVGVAPAASVWDHHVVLYDRAASRYTVYVNGEQMASDVPATRGAPGPARWLIGYHENPSYVGEGDNFRGTLDDVRVYDRLLAPSEIRELFGLATATPEGWRYWDGAVDATWDATTANWQGETWSDGLRAFFANPAGGPVNIDPAGVTARNLTFVTAGHTVSGGPVTTTSGGDPVVHALQNATVGSDLVLSGGQSWRTAEGATLTIDGNVNAAAPTAMGLRGRGHFVFNGSIGNNIAGLHFNSNEPTSVTFNAQNHFHGVIHLGGGGGADVLNFSHANQLGTGTGGNWIAIQNGATLRYTGSGAGTTTNRDLFWNIGPATIDIVEPGAELIFNITGGTRNQVLTKKGSGKMTLSGGGATGPIQLTEGTLKFGGIGTFSSATTVSSGAALELAGGTISGTVSGGGNLNITGTARTIGGMISLTGQIHISGDSQFFNDNLAANWTNNLADVHIEAGSTLNMRGNIIRLDALTGGGSVINNYYRADHENLTVGANNGSGTFSGVIAGSDTNFGSSSGRISVVKLGTGTQTFTGANTYTGNTTVAAGTLSLAQPTLDDASTVSIAEGAVLELTHSSTDRVGSLILAGVEQADGVYGAIGSGADFTTEMISGSGRIQVGAGGGYARWAEENGIPGALPGDDHDRDGISNLMEYALAGLSPIVPDGSAGSFDGTTLSFNKRAEAVDSGDVIYAIEVSTDLGQEVAWQEVAATVNNASVISYQLPAGLPSNFVRLRVTLVP